MDGQLTKAADRWQLRFTRTLPHPPEKVWRALTEPEHLAAWFPVQVLGERAAGAPLQFVFPNGEGPTLEGRMVVFEPPAVLELIWGDETLRFTLEPVDGGCVLTFLNTFDELGKAARDAAGWHTCLDLLGYELDGEAAPWTPPERWGEVHAGYVEAFGPP